VGLIIVYGGFEHHQDPADNIQQPGEATPEITPPDSSGQKQPGSDSGDKNPDETDKTDENDKEDGYDFMIYEPGNYKVGTDIPAGVYMAINDGSAVSGVTITDSPEPVKEKPDIIVTARYLSASSRFADRDAYVESVKKGGGTPVMPQDDPMLTSLLKEGLVEHATLLAERYDGLILTGGGDVAAHFFGQDHHPASNLPDEILDAAELALARAFIEAKKPILGICRGMQVLNIVCGGELIQDIPDLLGIDPGFHQDNSTRHPIKIRTGSWLYDLVGPEANVNSTHHQCVDGVVKGFTVVAQTGPVIEAMESGNILGVQFHPERLLNEDMLPLFEDFINRCSYNDIEIRFFSKNTIIEIKEGQFIDVTGATLVRIEHSLEMIKATYKKENNYSEGMYWIGHHMPEGVYRLFVSDDADFSSYAIYADTKRGSLLSSGPVPEEGLYIVLKEGQFIELIYASMIQLSPQRAASLP